MEWKSGDITWLPYYQITHLQALTDYLDLYGESKISKLPKGTGQPPQDDPQIFIGVVSFSSPPIPISTLSLFKNRLKSTTQNILSVVSSIFKRSFQFISTTVNPSMPPHRRSSLRGIDHPSFVRISPTTYLMKDPIFPIHTTIHTGQIAEYIKFDEQLRAQGDSFHSIPIGFTNFCNTWNGGLTLDDTRRISTVFIGEDPQDNYVIPSTHPVSLRDFHITPAQAGIAPEAVDQQSTALQADITQEFAAIMVARQKKQRQSYEERQEKRIQAFRTSVPVFPKYSHFGKHTRARRHRKQNIVPNTSSSSTRALTPERSVVPEDFEAPEDPENATPPEDPTHTSDPMEEVEQS
jgi:hypothetical protein